MIQPQLITLCFQSLTENRAFPQVADLHTPKSEALMSICKNKVVASPPDYQPMTLVVGPKSQQHVPAVLTAYKLHCPFKLGVE